MTATVLTNVLGRDSLEFSGSMNATSDILAVPNDLTGFTAVSVQVSGTFTGAMAIEVSNDGNNWQTRGLQQAPSGITTTIGAAGIYAGDLAAKFFRLRANSLTAGQAEILIIFTKASVNTHVGGAQAVSGSVTANLGSGGTSATSLGKAEDNLAASGDTGVAILGQRVPLTPVTRTSAVDEYGTLAIDAEGKQVIAGVGAAELTWDSNVNLTTTSDVPLKAAAAAGIRNFVKLLILENTAAAAARVLIKDGATTRATFTLAAGQTLIVPFDQPLRGTAATALNAALGAAGGTVTVTTLGFLGV